MTRLSSSPYYYNGGEATILLGAIAGLCSGLRISKKPRTVLFGAGALACAVFATANVLQFASAPPRIFFNRGASLAMIALCVMGLVHYIVHTGLGAIGNALKDDESIWHMWTRNFLWMSITILPGQR